MPRHISMRELSRAPASVVRGLQRSRDAVITHRGVPVARLTPLSDAEYEELLLGAIAERLELAPGHESVRPLREVLREYGVGRARRRPARTAG